MNFRSPKPFFFKARDVLVKYCGFIGPGFLIAVAYIDPGNYATDVEAGAATRYKHLFMILLSNLFAISCSPCASNWVPLRGWIWLRIAESIYQNGLPLLCTSLPNPSSLLRISQR